jgi:hypothetical protein
MVNKQGVFGLHYAACRLVKQSDGMGQNAFTRQGSQVQSLYHPPMKKGCLRVALSLCGATGGAKHSASERLVHGVAHRVLVHERVALLRHLRGAVAKDLAHDVEGHSALEQDRSARPAKVMEVDVAHSSR